jgi:sugar transferase (PEP-CTERM system associated)
MLAPSLLLLRRGYEWVVGRSVFRERIYVLGAGDYARSIVDTIRGRPDLGMEVVDWQDVQLEPSERKKVWIEALDKISKAKLPVHRIIVAMESRRGELPVQELLTLRFQGIAVEEDGTLRERLYGKIQLDGLRPSNFLYSEGFRIRASQQFTRQVVSICAAAFGLLLCMPFLPFVVLAVKLSSKGPVFFRQKRVGMGGHIFEVVKFRTMFTDAEADGAKWATKNDPRVTKVGMFLRKTRIDEIPQLWNVLRGDMGFVGPRPERPEFVNWLTEELPFYYLRTLIRPGLTGWAQVRYSYGATLAETKEKLEYDLYYIKHMSLGLDLLIMFETIKTILRRRGAQ